VIRTRGLRHISLSVSDLDRAVAFYTGAFGVEEYYRDDHSVQVKGPGPYDVIAFELDPEAAGRRAGISHFGFRLVHPDEIDAAVNECLKAGGTLLRRGAFSPGFPYAYISDPDGYEIEIWFE